MGRSQRALLETIKYFPTRNISVLDIGCGFGETVAAFKNAHFINVTGLDCSIKHIMKSQEFFPNCVFQSGCAEQLPFPPNSFEVVLLLDVIEHTDNEAPVISEAERVLKDGGLLIITVPHKGLTSFLDPANILFKLTNRKEHHKHYLSSEVEKMLNHDFDIQASESRGLGLSQLIHIVSFPIRKLFKNSTLIDKFIHQVEQSEYHKQTGPFGYHLFVSAIKKHS